MGNSQGTTLYNEDAFLVFLKSDGARYQSDACKTYTVCSVSTWTVSFLSSEFPSVKCIALNILRTHLICELSWSQPSRFGCRIKLIRVIMVWMHPQCFWTSTNFKSSLWDTSLDAEKPLRLTPQGLSTFQNWVLLRGFSHPSLEATPLLPEQNLMPFPFLQNKTHCICF